MGASDLTMASARVGAFKTPLDCRGGRAGAALAMDAVSLRFVAPLKGPFAARERGAGRCPDGR